MGRDGWPDHFGRTDDQFWRDLWHAIRDAFRPPRPGANR